MARLILISIPDNDEADKFIQAIKDDNVLRAVEVRDEFSREGHPEVEWNSLDGAKVEAVWGLPTLFCECDDYNGTSAPTQKMRWMVHAKCARPRKGAMQNPRDLTRIDMPAGQVPYYIGFRAGSDKYGYDRTKKG
jgi:hypothetical protein